MRKHIFGPVPSRRLGLSLGVDLTPTKTCTFDCLYCQLPQTRFHTSERQTFCNPDEVLAELRGVLADITKTDWITFSGTGEPTLSKDLGYMIAETKKITDTPICVITNSSLIHLPEVREALLMADKVLPTISSVYEKTWQTIHNPAANLKLKDVLEGLRIFTKAHKGASEAEIFVCPGLNDTNEEIKSLSDYINSTGLTSIYLNTAVRIPLRKDIIRTATPEELEEYKKKLEVQIPVSTAFEHMQVPKNESKSKKPLEETDITKLILRHPSSDEQMARVFGVSKEEIAKITIGLKQKDLIEQDPKSGYWALKN